MDEDFDLETERLLAEALKEQEDDGQDDDSGIDDKSDESGAEDNDSGTKEDNSEEDDDNGSSGDGDEKQHQESNEKSTKLEFEPIEVEVAGHKVTITSKEEMLAYIKAGASSYKKEPERFVEEKTILEQAGLSAEDLKLIAEAKKGSKEAIALIAKRAGVDIFDVENEMADSYKQQTEYYQPNEVDEVANEILADESHAGEFRRIASSLPSEFMEAITSNANDLKAFSGHIKSGIAQKVIPLAINSQIVNGGSFIDNYNKVGQQLAQQPKKKREVSEREQEFRKRASSGKGNNHQTQSASDKDIWDMSDEDFEKLDLSKLR